MATSDSDDFESADEEIEVRQSCPKKSKWIAQSTIGSDTDDDNECITPARGISWSDEIKNQTAGTTTSTRHSTNSALKNTENDETDRLSQKCSTLQIGSSDKREDKHPEVSSGSEVKEDQVPHDVKSRPGRREPRQQKPKVSKPSLGARKLGSKVMSESASVDTQTKAPTEPPMMQECWECDDDDAIQPENSALHENTQPKMSSKIPDLDGLDKEDVPEELKSNKKFKEIFSDGWEGLEDDGDSLLAELDNENGRSTIDKDSPKNMNNQVATDFGGNWGSWGNWGVTSLLTTASVGVSTLSNHVSHGLSLLEETIGYNSEATTPQTDPSEERVSAASSENAPPPMQDHQLQSSFGFSNLISGVSSITKLVESTGTKVIVGGLGTLETIGKKTMEVLQEGDPGLKKKRAFFMNESDKPILSQILREAKEKAETEEKTVEEKQQARKVHFETLFDDFQGLVHLEALEMLSKQSTIKIQQKLVSTDADEMISIQETLEEIKELCNVDDEDENEPNEFEDLKEKLQVTCADLNIAISYDKIDKLWEETKNCVSSFSQAESGVSDREILQKAISTLAQFTAYCVERFHKTAELVLIKEHRSTVNEADALVQLTKLLSGQIGLVANLFSKCIDQRNKGSDKSVGNAYITPIFLEATNASSYIQEAFRLLIPILQVGAI